MPSLEAIYSQPEKAITTPWRVFAIACIAIFMVSVDTTILLLCLLINTHPRQLLVKSNSTV